MKLFTHTLFFFMLVSQVCFGQLERQSHPQFYDEERTDHLFNPANMDSTQLDSIIIATMSSNHIPGLSALIIKKEGGIVWKRNYGYANVAQNKEVEDTTLFLLASISKTILATAVMQFWEADSFNLDDPINNYLEGFQVFNPNYPSTTITIKMLMTHTSSILDNWTVLWPLNFCGDSPIPLDTLLINYFTPGGSYYNPSLNFSNYSPGAAFNYSNVATSLLALLIEKFSGISFNQYCRENIFNSLEMYKTSFLLAELDSNDIATPYLWNGSQYVPYCHMGHPFYPVAFLRSNKMELSNFLSAYMNWGEYNGNRILDSSTVALMLSDHLGYPIPGYGGYQGLIWWQEGEMNGRLPWGHTGSYSGARAGMFFKQEEDWGIICIMNSEESFTTLMYLLNKLCDYAQDITEVEGISNIISDFYLAQNYPNPFNPTTIITYTLPERGNVSLKVYDLLGSEVAQLVNGEIEAGSYDISFNAANLPSGVYFYQLKTSEFVQTRKMILMK